MHDFEAHTGSAQGQFHFGNVTVFMVLKLHVTLKKILHLHNIRANTHNLTQRKQVYEK